MTKKVVEINRILIVSRHLKIINTFLSLLKKAINSCPKDSCGDYQEVIYSFFSNQLEKKVSIILAQLLRNKKTLSFSTHRFRFSLLLCIFAKTKNLCK